jgi:hypothetical protein
VKIVEDRHPGESWLQWKLGNLLSIDGDRMRSWAVAWGFREGGRWVWRPRRCGSGALFFNAVFFLRLNWPAGIFLAFRWSASSIRKALFQTGAGFKLNGRFAILLRVQSDATAAAGVNGPNHGQAQGFQFGPH